MSATPPSTTSDLADRIDRVLPQTQCTQCGFNGCRPYAEAIAKGDADINQCPPGGAAGIARLARLLDRPVVPLNPVHGVEAPLQIAVVGEAHCIGCTLCIQACPVDATVGAAKQMHTVLPELCTGCKLCIAPCPVDCIVLVDAPFAWDDRRAADARDRYEARKLRLIRDQAENDERLATKAEAKLAELEPQSGDPAIQRKKAIIEAALARSRQLRKLANKAD